jgi:2-dehydro-3-deoxy-phosphogluconate aldolase
MMKNGSLKNLQGFWMNMTKFNFYKGKVVINCLAKDLDNAKEVLAAAESHLAVGLLSTRHPTVAENVAEVRSFQKEIPLVSVGLGGGSPKQWSMAAEIASETDPGHVNQVFPAAGYTLGLLKGKGCVHTVVNALISPTAVRGKVKINTGVYSSDLEDAVDIDTALLMMKDIGLNSVKFFNMKGLKYLDALRDVAEACVKYEIDMVEPTGGITPENVGEIVAVCLLAGVSHVMPHVYSSIIDPVDGRTQPNAVSQILETVKAEVDKVV